MLVSVYMPTKNRLELLQRAVTSVLAQTHAEVELLVANDGSTDGTRAYLDELAQRDSRVVAIHFDQSGGAPRARNEAIRRARGVWVTGLDDDDEFKPRRIAALLEYAALLEGVGEPFSALFTQDEVRRATGTSYSNKRGHVRFMDLFERNLIGNQIFVRRQFVEAVGLFDEDMPAWQDLDLIMRIVDRFGPARLLDAPLYVFTDDARTDRISNAGKSRLLQAFSRLSAKWPQVHRKQHQLLLLQIFGPHYRSRMDWHDARRYLGLAHGPREWAWLVKRFAKQRGF